MMVQGVLPMVTGQTFRCDSLLRVVSYGSYFCWLVARGLYSVGFMVCGSLSMDKCDVLMEFSFLVKKTF